jgi:hypothetical protein
MHDRIADFKNNLSGLNYRDVSAKGADVEGRLILSKVYYKLHRLRQAQPDNI